MATDVGNIVATCELDSFVELVVTLRWLYLRLKPQTRLGSNGLLRLGLGLVDSGLGLGLGRPGLIHCKSDAYYSDACDKGNTLTCCKFYFCVLQWFGLGFVTLGAFHCA